VRAAVLRPYLLLAALATAGALPAAAAAQDTAQDARADWRAYAAMPLHGWGDLTPEVRQAIRSDCAAIDSLAALLAGSLTVEAWDSAMVVWWLAESGRAEFLPVFLEHSRVPALPMLEAAAYGLARLADRDSAARRLRQVAVEAPPHARLVVLLVLAHVNSPAARQVLRSLDLSGFGPLAGPLVDAVLAAPATEAGYYPCPRGSRFRRDDDGAFRCVAEVP
jgi:nitroreductase